MAAVTITYTWAGGDSLAVNVETQAEHPAALVEAKRVALDGYREALGLTMVAES